MSGGSLGKGMLKRSVILELFVKCRCTIPSVVQGFGITWEHLNADSQAPSPISESASAF